MSVPTAEEITEGWGERCPDYDPDCSCCQIWAMHDRIEELSRLLTDEQTANVCYTEDFAAMKERATIAESNLAEARADALEEAQAAYTAGFNASAQGWNGEHGCDTDTDTDFIVSRDAYFRAFRAQAIRDRAALAEDKGGGE